MPSDTPSEDLTGLSYNGWEEDTSAIEQVVTHSERTGLLDRRHLQQTATVGEALSDEISVVDDVCELSEDEAKAELLNIRSRLELMRSRIWTAQSRMLRFRPNSRG